MPPSRKVIALIGLRCSGKTSVGTELARILSLPFFDLDREIERLYALRVEPPTPAKTSAPKVTRVPAPPRASAGEILQSEGEPAFRELESQALTEILASPTRCVLATGGGIVEREENRRELAEHALCIWLRVDTTELARRLRTDPTPRPSLTGEDPASEIPKLALRRDPYYAALAHTTLDGTRPSPAELAEKLARELIASKDLGLQG